MMPLCQCFARRVKSGRGDASRHRDIGRLFALDKSEKDLLGTN
ncbi:hypothetical protein CDS [Bradyrhizobium sp.]|nr:hypothetical protein CDS [Bradyrhizobium sp.]